MIEVKKETIKNFSYLISWYVRIFFSKVDGDLIEEDNDVEEVQAKNEDEHDDEQEEEEDSVRFEDFAAATTTTTFITGYHWLLKKKILNIFITVAKADNVDCSLTGNGVCKLG